MAGSSDKKKEAIHLAKKKDVTVFFKDIYTGEQWLETNYMLY